MLHKYLTDDQYERLRNFMYLKTPADVREFEKWVESLHIKEIDGTAFISIIFHG